MLVYAAFYAALGMLLFFDRGLLAFSNVFLLVYYLLSSCSFLPQLLILSGLVLLWGLNGLGRFLKNTFPNNVPFLLGVVIVFSRYGSKLFRSRDGAVSSVLS